MIAAVSIQTLGEALALAKKAGVEPETFAAALEQNACRSGTMELKLPKMMRGDYEPHFSLKHMFKDVQLGIHLANALDVEIPATTVTAGVMYGALNHGWGDLDFASIFKIYDDAFDNGEIEYPDPLLAAHADASEAQPTDRAAAPGALEMIDALPMDAEAAGAKTGGAEERDAARRPAEGEEIFAKPFNRIKRFFSPYGG
jgi:hypothetical protein